MKIDILDIDNVVQVNALDAVSSPKIFSQGKNFNPDGIFSNEIFGISKGDRRNQFAYIDLKGPYIHPHIYDKVLKRSFLAITDIVSGLKKFTIVDGWLKEDPNGWTGLNELYEHWNKIDWSMSESVNKENIFMLAKMPRDKLFIHKFLVCPPAHRDIMIGGEAQTSSDKVDSVNPLYTKLISAVQVLADGGLFSRMQYATQFKIQELLTMIYNFFNKKISKKTGLIRNSLMGRNTSYGSRVVISAPTYAFDRYEDKICEINTLLIPISVCCSSFYPFILTWFKNNMNRFYQDSLANSTHSDNSGKWVVKDPDKQFGEKRIKKMIDNYIKNPDTRFNPISYQMANEKGEVREMGFKLRGKLIFPDSHEEKLERPMTITDMLYLACVDCCEKRHGFLSRYPIGVDKSLLFMKIRVMSTIKWQKMIYNGKEYPFYPKIDLKTPPHMVSTQFIDTVTMPNTRAKVMSADYDGDQVSFRGIWSEEANAEIARSLEMKISTLDIEAKSAFSSEEECITSLYMLTRNYDGGVTIPANEQKEILERPVKELTLSYFIKLFAKTANGGNKLSNHKVKYHTHDKITVPANHFYQGQPQVETTIGRYLYNKFVLSTSQTMKETKYYDKPMTKKELEAINGFMGTLLLNDVINRIQFNEYINRRDVLAHWLIGPLCTPISPKTMKPIKAVEQKRDELIKKYQKELDKCDINVMADIENELCKYAKEQLKGDFGMDLYDSGQLKFENNYKNNFITKGLSRDTVKNEYRFVRNSYSEGANPEDFPILSNTLVYSEYQKGIKTRTSGYMGKKLIALLQMMEVDEPGTDCGTRNLIPILISKRNKRDVMYSYIMEQGKLILLTPENIEKYVGKEMLMRSPMSCISPGKICNKCAGEVFNKLGLRKIGFFCNTINYRFLNYSMKLKHDITVKLSHIDPDKFIEDI